MEDSNISVTARSHRQICTSYTAAFQFQVFAYDYCFWSMDETDKEKFAGTVMKRQVHIFTGFNIYLLIEF